MFTQKVGNSSARQETQKLFVKFTQAPPLWLIRIQDLNIHKVASFNTKNLTALTQKQRPHKNNELHTLLCMKTQNRQQLAENIFTRMYTV